MTANSPILPFLDGNSEVGRLMRATDWARTPVGPPDTWPQSLRTVVRIMLASRYAMWMAWGPDLTFFCNDAYLPTVGIKRSWVLGTTARKVWEEIWLDIGPRIERVLSSGPATWDEGLLLFLERSGYPEETYHTFSYSPVFDDDGGIGGMLCVVTEETERVIGERRMGLLRELGSALASVRTEAQLAAAIERCLADSRDVPFALTYLLDHASARLTARTGLPADHAAAPETLTGGGVWPLGLGHVVDLAARVGPLPPGPWPKPPDQALVVPIPLQGHDEPAGVFVAGVNPYRALDASYRGFIDLLVGQIASSLASVRAYAAERQRAEALAEIDRAKTAFFSNVSHEFRTPLTLMTGPLEEALQAPDANLPPGVRENLAVAHRNSLRLLKLVNTLLDFSRIEAGRARAVYAPVDLALVTRDLASVFRSATERAGLRFAVDCPPLTRLVDVDRDMWEKIVLNLISNAFKYTLEGEIRVSLGESGDCVRLEVADTGTGIPEDALPHLFERFYRVPGAPGRTHEGTGIGLALVHELVQQHSGTIHVASRVGEGTRFVVELPVHQESARPVPANAVPPVATGRAAAFVEEALRWLPGEASPSGLASDQPLSALASTAPPAATVLVVDDNADMRDYVKRILSASYSVIVAGDGREALAAVARARPDLVLTDVMMPNLDGLGLLSALRADPNTRGLPVIMLSARAGEEARVEGLEAGADDYLTKPFGARELQARVSGALELARVRREADRRKDEFLATLAHELRNPLAPIRNSLELVRVAGLGDPRQQQAYRVMERQLATLVHLVDDLLDLSRITRGKLELRKERVSLSAVLAAAMETTGPVLEARGHALELDLPGGGLALNADSVRLAQVFSNLLANSAKYTPRTGRIRVVARRMDGTVVVRVEDNGIGIPAEALRDVFEMFTQVRTPDGPRESGLGIGLAVVKRLVEMHGGEVHAESAGPAKGSAFVVTLPLAEEAAAAPPPEVRTVLRPHPTARRVLVVDDNLDSAQTLAELLSAMGHEAVEAHDGEDAVAVVEKLLPDLVLMDLGMPRVDGLMAAARIRALPLPFQPVIVALTGWGQDADRARAQAAGMEHHMVKPVDIPRLKELLAAVQPRSAVDSSS